MNGRIINRIKSQYIVIITLLFCMLVFSCGGGPGSDGGNVASPGGGDPGPGDGDVPPPGGGGSGEIEEDPDPPSGTCRNIKLFGPDYYELSSTGNANPNYWKAVRNLAVESGIPSCVRVEVIEYIGDRINDTIKYAIYNDNNGEVGTLLFAGKLEGYDWTDIGVGVHEFSIDPVLDITNIDENSYYWIAVYSSAGEELWFSRGGGEPDPTMPRRAAATTHDRPTGEEFSIHLDDGNYGWSVW